MNQGICWIEGQIIPLSEARISVLDHGLLYGDGVFEGVRYYHGSPFLLEQHLLRLLDSARAIRLDCPWSMAQLRTIIFDTVAASPVQDGYLRVILTRGEGALGIDPELCKKPNLIVIAAALKMADDALKEQGAQLMIAATRRLPADGLDPRIKSLNYLNHILARMEATQAGADEAVLLNQQGFISEGSADNIFITKDGYLLTPPVTDGALDGITRKLILELAGQQRIQTRVQSLTAYDLYTADECFLTGTGAELIPVRSIDGRPVSACPGSVFRQLQDLFLDYVHRQCKTGS